MEISHEQYCNWLEAIQNYYAWNEEEYHINKEISESMRKTIDEMRMTLVVKG